MTQDLKFLLAKELGWSVADMLGLTKRVLEWKKNNPMICPFMTKRK
jgi:hypothetical protein